MAMSPSQSGETLIEMDSPTVDIVPPSDTRGKGVKFCMPGEEDTDDLNDSNHAHVNPAFEDDNLGPALEPSYRLSSLDTNLIRTTLDIPSPGPLDRLKSSSDPGLHRQEDGSLTPNSEKLAKGILKSPKMQALQKMLSAANSSPQQRVRRRSSIALEMLLNVQDRDLHPYGRGGVYEGALKGIQDDSELNTSKALAWIILCGMVSFASFGIVVLAELERQNYNTTGTLKERKTIWSIFFGWQ